MNVEDVLMKKMLWENKYNENVFIKMAKVLINHAMVSIRVNKIICFGGRGRERGDSCQIIWEILEINSLTAIFKYIFY